MYLYLNDVEAGGGTNFLYLHITVMPKRGRAVLWPSVKNHNPNKEDKRTKHQALPVDGGIKYGANAVRCTIQFLALYSLNKKKTPKQM